MDESNWGHLLESLEEESCILCIGPGVYSHGGDRQETRLAAFLQERADEIGIRVYEDGWFHYLPNASEIDAWQQLKEFYIQSDAASNALLSKLAAIPFHFSLNFTPDYRLKEIMEAKDFSFDFLSYRKNEPFDAGLLVNQHLPTRNRPLVYNMLGELRKRNSLVMTYNDFYGYLESVFAGRSMAPVLKENIWEADYFVFLGMPFDRWYVHMFMRILQQHERNRSSKKYAANVNLSQEVTTHCAEQYTMTFVPNNIEQFITEFHDRCEQRGLLRTKATTKALRLPYQELEAWAIKNKFELIFEELIKKLEAFGERGESWRLQTLQLEGRHNQLKISIRNGVIAQRDLDLEFNRIRMAMLGLIQELKQKFA